MKLLVLFLLLLCLVDSKSSSLDEISPSSNPQPLYPLLAPSPLSPFTITNTTTPKLSGLCSLDFNSAEHMMHITAVDCFTVFAPYLANVVCCPQFKSTINVLIGQSSKTTKLLSLNSTSAKHCLSDFDRILVSQGANNSLPQICSVGPSNLTVASCPIYDVDGLERTVNTSKLLSACEKIDLVNECCQEVCQNAISEAAKNLAAMTFGLDSGFSPPSHVSIKAVNDCKSIVLRWLASKMEPLRAKDVLRGLANCKLNKVCPLVLPNVKPVTQGCGDEINNKTSSCCGAMESYVSHLQKQSFLTNLQALNCAASLGMKLQNANITKDVYKLCHVTLQDFSLQANGMQESGCLLPSLPSDATFDTSSGISFLCDLNDHIPAPWPSASHLSTSSCNKTAVKIPALPAAASGQRGLYNEDAMLLLLYAATLVVIAIY